MGETPFVQLALDHADGKVHRMSVDYIRQNSRPGEASWRVVRCPECGRDCPVVARDVSAWRPARDSDY